ncbi:MAG: hypothetical protein KBB83_04010 [Alphaproteobacteria bacterium]|nr:hypothetical protein [Alphaproteobacteria bacterium]
MAELFVTLNGRSQEKTPSIKLRLVMAGIPGYYYSLQTKNTDCLLLGIRFFAFLFFFTCMTGLADAAFLTSKHKKDFSRLSFNWGSEVEYQMKQEGQLVTIRFKKSHPITKSQIDTQLNQHDLHLYSFATDKDFLEISFQMKRPGHALTLNKDGVVSLDFVFQGTEVEKKPPENPKPEAVPDKKEEKKIEEASATPSAIPILIEEKIEGVRLIFDFPQEISAGAFIEGGDLWVFFSHPTQFSWDAEAMRNSQIIHDITTFKSTNLSVLKIDLNTEPDKAILYKKGHQWVLENTDMQALIPTYVQAMHADQSLLLKEDTFDEPIYAQMPRTGHPRYFVPVREGNLRLDRKRRYVDCCLQPTLLGAIIDPLSQGVRVEKQDQGIVITKDDGLQISPAMDLHSNRVRYKLPSLFNFTAWLEEDQGASEDELQREINQAEKSARTPQRMKVVKRYLFTKRYFEAKGLLASALSYEPGLEKSPFYHSLLGLSAFSAQKYDEALHSFSHPSLSGDAEIQMWQELSKCRDEPYEVQYPILLEGLAHLQGYPEFIKTPALLLAAHIAILQNKDAKPFLEQVDKEKLGVRQKEQLEYMLAYRDVISGNVADAIKLLANYSQIMQSEYRLKSNLLLLKLKAQEKSISPEEEIKQLEKLRYGWSGDQSEYQLWTRMSECYAAVKKYPLSLKFLRKALRHFPKLSSIDNLQPLGEKRFVQAIEDPESDLFEKIGMFQEYDLFMPKGDGLIKMQEKLIDLLVQADLVDQAMEQMDACLKQEALPQEQKEKIRLRYGLLALLNDKADKTLDILGYKPEVSPAEWSEQKLFLIAQALLMQEKHEEMRVLLNQNHSPAAYDLIVQSYMDQKDWPRLARYIQDHLNEQKKSQSTIQPEAVLRLATVFSLLEQDKSLQKLRAEYGAMMSESSVKDVFDLLTSEDPSDFSTAGLHRELENSQNMMKVLDGYREKIKTQGLSSF